MELREREKGKENDRASVMSHKIIREVEDTRVCIRSY
jgi:hypothetical protein